MKRLPPAKRNQLIIVSAVTLGLIGAVYLFLISPQNQKNARLAQDIAAETSKEQQYRTAISHLEETTNLLNDVTHQLEHAEKDVASGDLYAWSVETFRRFKTGYKVEIPTIGQPSGVSDCDLIPDFPYKQVRFTLTGTAFYHDLGKFVSDFENKFPHCRVLNLSADPVDLNSSTGERLNFRMDIVALVKPNS
jgi:hypothetical protein